MFLLIVPASLSGHPCHLLMWAPAANTPPPTQQPDISHPLPPRASHCSMGLASLSLGQELQWTLRARHGTALSTAARPPGARTQPCFLPPYSVWSTSGRPFFLPVKSPASSARLSSKALFSQSFSEARAGSWVHYLRPNKQTFTKDPILLCLFSQK